MVCTFKAIHNQRDLILTQPNQRIKNHFLVYSTVFVKSAPVHTLGSFIVRAINRGANNLHRPRGGESRSEQREDSAAAAASGDALYAVLYICRGRVPSRARGESATGPHHHRIEGEHYVDVRAQSRLRAGARLFPSFPLLRALTYF